MAGTQLLAPSPMISLEAGCTITLEALSPTTGAAITGVTITLGAIYASNDKPGTFEQAYDSLYTHTGAEP